MHLNDTIVAISTPPGRSALGVVRLSGPDARTIALRLLHVSGELQHRHVSLARLTHLDEVIDQVLVTPFFSPSSYTGEDVIEISCHGSPVILRRAVELALEYGARLAEPGEFTLRAFLNGRIDLPRAEAVHDLIEATTVYQATIAAQQLSGSVSRALQPVKNQLLELVALLEAGIDFAEDDISVAPTAEILRRLEPILTDLRRLSRGLDYGGLIRSGFTLAIVGRPNVGKSSLFNRLLDSDRAIVTDIPGTTRDLISETGSFGGIPVRLLDTAGLRETSEPIESLGIERSYQAMADADVTLLVLDASAPLTPDDAAIRQRGPCLVVANKADLGVAWHEPGVLPVSAKTGAGLDDLRNAVLKHLAPDTESATSGLIITSARQAAHLKKCLEAIEKTKLVCGSVPHEMTLVDLYGALHHLDSLTGRTTADDILNRIFTSFCIGK